MQGSESNAKATSRLMDLAKARRFMAEEGLDALVSHSKHNVYYTSEFRCFDYKLDLEAVAFSVITSGPGEPSYLVAPHSDRFILLDFPTWMEKRTWFGRYFIKGSPEDGSPLEDGAVDGLVRALSDLGATGKRIGLELELLPLALYQEIEDRLPEAELVNASPLFNRLRMVKSPEEIRRLTEATRIIDQAVREAIAVAHPGVSELALHCVVAESVAAQGAELRYLTIGTSERAAYGQCYPTERRLRVGDTIKFDASSIYQEYVSDIGCTCAVGQPSAEVEHYYDVVWRAGQAAADMVKPGVRMADVFETGMRVPREEGITDLRRHHIGHSIGLEHEGPRFTPHTEQRLEENMVLCLEVPYYVWGLGGFHAERTIRVTRDGCEYLYMPERHLPRSG